MKSAYSNFAKYFIATFAPEIFNVYLREVELYISSQEWLSSKCQYLIFQFLTEWCVLVLILLLFVASFLGTNTFLLFVASVKPKSTWILLKPHFESLVSTFVFPQLCFNYSRKTLWENDPVDYVRISVGEIFPSPPFFFFFSRHSSKSYIHLKRVRLILSFVHLS